MHVVAVGHSVGGSGVLALAHAWDDPPERPPPGLRAVVNFAGGHGSIGSHDVCQPERLVVAFGAFGAHATVPSLWLYAADDSYFWPDLARQMHAAYAQGNPRAELRFEPPHPLWPGHSYIFGAIVPCALPVCYGADAVWPPQVFDFLRRAGVQR